MSLPLLLVDFDGTCTDLERDPRVPPVGPRRHEYLASAESAVASVVRAELLQLLSVLNLFGEVRIVTARPQDHKPAIWSWLVHQGLDRLVASVMCCHGIAAKIRSVAAIRPMLLLDDDPIMLSSAVTVLCRDQVGGALIDEVLMALSDQHAPLRVDSSFELLRAQRISEWGASDAFLLIGLDHRLRKLRVCHSDLVCRRLTHFLSATHSNELECFPTLLEAVGVAIVKDYIPGQSVRCHPAMGRATVIQKVADELATLHAVRPDDHLWRNLGLPWLACSDPRYLACAADWNNIVVRGDGAIAFVDVECVTLGARWVDLAWAEDLLCGSSCERDILREKYTAASGCSWPGPQDWASYQLQYLDWLVEQLVASAAVHPENGALANRLRERQAQRLALTGARDATPLP